MHVLGCHVVECATHRSCTDDRSVAECLSDILLCRSGETRADDSLCLADILGLQTTIMSDDIRDSRIVMVGEEV